MKPKIPPFAIIILVLLLAGGGGYWYYTNNPQAWQQTRSSLGLAATEGANADLIASGSIEADEISLAAEVSGRIVEMGVEQGDTVEAGQTVVKIDTALLDAQSQQIEAQIALAEAQLAQLKASVPAEKVAVAQAAIDLARAEKEAAYQTWQDAVVLKDTPQQLNAQIDAANSQIALIDLQIEQAALIRDALEQRNSIAQDQWDFMQKGIDWSVTIPAINFHKSGHHDFDEGDKQQASVQWNLATMEVWQGWVNYENAVASRETTLSELYTLQTLKKDPLQAELQVTQTEADYHTKEAAIGVAQAELVQLNAGAPDSRIEVLEANLQSARAQLVTLAARQEKYTLTAPLSGVVLEQVAHQGELAVPGASLVTMADLREVTLTVFVAASDYGRLREGQAVEVTVDSHPGQVFKGVVTHISNEAEFTPKNVQTQEERVNLVYAIKITLPNESGLLKPGMPADARFIEAMAR